MTIMPLSHARLRVLVLVVSSSVACTRVTGVIPTDVVVDHALDATADVLGGEGPSACPPPTPGRAAGEPDLTLQDLVDPRIADFYIKGAAQDALGRIYVYGALLGCSAPGGPTDVAVVRLMEDGTLDPTFGDAGIACTGRAADDPLPNAAFAMAFDDRGRPVLAGLYYIGVVPGALVARFDADGRPDEGFGHGGFRRLAIELERGMPSASCFFVLAEADGLVLAGAQRDPFDESTYGFVTRLREDGTPDPGFHRGEVWFDPSSWAFSSIVRTPRGYAVAGASRAEYRPRVVMLGRDGELVTSFSTGGVATHAQRDLLVRGLELDARGGFVLAGGIRDTRSAGLVRFTPDGQTDGAFGLDGLATLGVPWLPAYQLAPALARQCDGRLLVAGNVGESGFTLTRVEANGRRDDLFGDGGDVRVEPVRGTSSVHVYAVLVHPRDGRITVVTSVTDDRDIELWRFWP